MEKKTASAITLTLLLTGMLTFTLDISLVASNPETFSIGIIWKPKTDMPTARGYLFRGRSAIGEKICVIGGWNGADLDTVETYEVDKDVWTVGKHLPASLDDGAVQVVDNKLYVIGGSYASVAAVSTVWEYDAVLDTWTSKSSMPTGRRSLASATVDGRIYTISGVDTGNMISAAVEMYDPSSNTWEIKSPHPLPRQYLTAEAVNGKIYTFGGNEYSNKVHEYDPVLDSWTEKSPMPLYISTPNSVTVGDKIFVVGGSGSRDVIMYDPVADSWETLLDSLPTERSLPLTGEVNGKIYVIGGAGPGGYSAANEEGSVSTVPITPKTILVPDDYPTIQEAINNASNGDTVYVRQGAYVENIMVNKSISIVGENKSMTVINGNGTGTTVTVKAFNASIEEFTITNGTNGGLVIFGSSDIIVTNCVITNNSGPEYPDYFSGAGISAYNSMNCIISQNLISSNDKTAIEIGSSDNITIDGNDVDGNGGGIFISSSTGCTLKRNNITGQRLNFGVDGWGLSSYIHDIDSSNTINGKPILYIVNEDSLQLEPATFPKIGYLALVNSTNIVVKDFDFSGNYQGILLVSTNNSVIQNVIVSNNTYGIHSFYSGGNKIIDCVASENYEGIFMRYSKTGNTFINLTASNNNEGLFIGDCGYINIAGSNISDNEWYGIWLTACYYGENNISHNTIANNQYGIRLDFSPSLVRENIIANNDVGLWLSYSKNSLIFHNNFMSNIKQVHYKYSTPTNWDDGYPSGGNYWSDYSGLDEKSGPNQDQPGSDGIGDVSYQIPILNTFDNIVGFDCDNYPLMKPWGPVEMVFDVIWKGVVYPVAVVSNSTITNFNFTYSLKQISFNIAGPDGTIGFCNVTIPKALLWVETPDEWILLIDGNPPIILAITENATHNSLYFTYTHSTHEVRIIGTHVIAPPPPPLSVSVSPLSASILVGQSLIFTSTVSGGYTPYSYQWYLNGAPVSGATSASWTFTPTTSGIYYVHLKVTDNKGNTAQSETARVTVTVVPVGGYSTPIKIQTKTEPIIPYIALIASLTAIFTKLRPKTRARHKN